jgi:hypothetical protein
MKLLTRIKRFLFPAIVECQSCGVSKHRSKMVWGFSYWFCCAAHRDKYWNVGNRFVSSGTEA